MVTKELGECKICGVPLFAEGLSPRQLEAFGATGMCPDCSRKTYKSMKDDPYPDWDD